MKSKLKAQHKPLTKGEFALFHADAAKRCTEAAIDMLQRDGEHFRSMELPIDPKGIKQIRRALAMHNNTRSKFGLPAIELGLR